MEVLDHTEGIPIERQYMKPYGRTVSSAEHHLFVKPEVVGGFGGSFPADLFFDRHLDERSAGFFALGLAVATDKPVALVCTSGTAVANYFPAIIEAHMSQVPLLILTADRPHELRHSGANQTIDQVRIFGDFCRWFMDVSPSDEPGAAAAAADQASLKSPVKSP